MIHNSIIQQDVQLINQYVTFKLTSGSWSSRKGWDAEGEGEGEGELITIYVKLKST